MYLRHGARDHDRLPPPAHPPRLPDPQAGRVRARRGRLDGGPGPGDRLGRRPPQAPRPHRRGGRPALPARRPRHAASRGLWHAHVGWLFDANGQADRRKYAPDLMDDPGMRLLNRRFLGLVVLSPRGCRPLLGFAAHRHARRRRSPGCSGAGFVRIFFVHHVTWSINSICHFHGSRRFDDRRPLDQRLVALARLARRGLAPQPPRLPALGRPRPAPLGARPVGARSSARCSGSGWPGTWCGSRRSARTATGIGAQRRCARARPDAGAA